MSIRGKVIPLPPHGPGGAAPGKAGGQPAREMAAAGGRAAAGRERAERFDRAEGLFEARAPRAGRDQKQRRADVRGQRMALLGIVRRDHARGPGLHGEIFGAQIIGKGGEIGAPFADRRSRAVVACRLRRVLRQIASAEYALVKIAPGNAGYPAAMSQAIGGGFEKQPKSRRRAQARYCDSSKYRSTAE